MTQATEAAAAATKAKPTIDWIRGNAVIAWFEIEIADHENEGLSAICNAYDRAVAKAKQYGGRKFHNKSYGGGIAFNCEAKAVKCFRAFNS